MTTKRVLRTAFKVKIPKKEIGKKLSFVAGAYGVLAHNLNERHIGLANFDTPQDIIALVDLTGEGLAKLEAGLHEIKAEFERVIVEMDKDYPYNRFCFLLKDAHLKIVQREW